MKALRNRNISGQVDNVCLTAKWSRRTWRQHHAKGASTSKTIVTLAGLVLIGLFVWSVIEVQNNKNVDAKTKRSMYLVIVPIFMITAKIAILWM